MADDSVPPLPSGNKPAKKSIVGIIVAVFGTLLGIIIFASVIAVVMDSGGNNKSQNTANIQANTATPEDTAGSADNDANETTGQQGQQQLDIADQFLISDWQGTFKFDPYNSKHDRFEYSYILQNNSNENYGSGCLVKLYLYDANNVLVQDTNESVNGSFNIGDKIKVSGGRYVENLKDVRLGKISIKINGQEYFSDQWQVYFLDGKATLGSQPPLDTESEVQTSNGSGQSSQTQGDISNMFIFSDLRIEGDTLHAIVTNNTGQNVMLNLVYQIGGRRVFGLYLFDENETLLGYGANLGNVLSKDSLGHGESTEITFTARDYMDKASMGIIEFSESFDQTGENNTYSSEDWIIDFSDSNATFRN